MSVIPPLPPEIQPPQKEHSGDAARGHSPAGGFSMYSYSHGPRRITAAGTLQAAAAPLAAFIGLYVLVSWLMGDAIEKHAETQAAAIAAEMRARPPTVDIVVSDGEQFGVRSLAVCSDAVEPTASKPRANEAITATLWGIDYSEVDRKNESFEALSTTTIEALDVDIAASEQTEQYSQNIWFANRDATGYICVAATTWASSCSALTMTCRAGSTTDGHVIGPGEKRPLRFLGTERPCLEATAAISAYDVERITYKGTEY